MGPKADLAIKKGAEAPRFLLVRSAFDLRLDVLFGGLAIGRQNATQLSHVELQRLAIDRLGIAKGVKAFNAVIRTHP